MTNDELVDICKQIVLNHEHNQVLTDEISMWRHIFLKDHVEDRYLKYPHKEILISNCFLATPSRDMTDPVGILQQLIKSMENKG